MRTMIRVLMLAVLLVSLFVPLHAAADSLDQLLDGSWMTFESTGTQRGGERFNDWPASIIHSVSFKLWKSGSPTGWGYAVVRNVSDDEILGYLGSIDVATLTTSPTWYTFNMYDAEVSGARDIRVLFEYGGGSGATHVHVATHNGDVYGGGYQTQCNADHVYNNLSAYECTWENLTYDLKGVAAPMGETLLASDIGNDSATLNGRVLDDGNYTCTGYFEWGKTPDPETWFTGNETGLETGDYTSQGLTGLAPETWYFYRLRLESEGGWDFGDIEGFKTTITCEWCTPVGSTLDASDVTAQTATLWAYVDCDGDIGNVTCAHIEWNLEGANGDFRVLIDAQPLEQGTALSYAVGNLTPGCDYDYYADFSGSGGLHHFGGRKSFHTEDSSVADVPTVWSEGATYIGNTTALLRGAIFWDGGLGCVPGISYRVKGSSTWISFELTDKIYHTADGFAFWAGEWSAALSPATEYEYFAYARNALGTGTGETVSFKTSVGAGAGVTPTPSPWLPPIPGLPGLTPNIKIIIALLVTVGGMLLVGMKAKGKAASLLVLAVGAACVIGFTIFGWYPSYVIILIGGVIGLLILLMVAGRGH
jgi:hypothetical protein